MPADPLLAAVVGVAVVQALVWLWVAFGLGRVRREALERGLDAPDLTPEVPLSVVVAARDEAARLPALLDALAAQTHRDADGRPRFEVVVVDDRSRDATARVLATAAARLAESDGLALRVVTVGEGAPEAAGLPPKKHALARGIEAAAFERVALTDADCIPPPDWLATLARHAAPDDAPGTAREDDGAVLVGPAPLVRAGGTLGLLARFETVQTALLAAAGIGWGRAWQATGRNLSYPRDLPARLGGFHPATLSGDDDLLVQAAARADVPVRYVLDARAAVPSEAPASWGAFWRQKRRHAAAGAHYAPGVLVALGVLRVSALALWAGAPLHAVATGRPTAWGVLALALLVQRMAWRDADAVGADGDVRLLQPLLDAASAVYHAAFAVLGALPGPRRW